MCVMIAVPVLTPGSQLQGTKPPDVLTRIHTLFKAGLQMQQAVHECLHVKAVDEANCAHPEQTAPSKEQITESDGYQNQRSLQFVPCQITSAEEVRTPLIHRRGPPLIQPSHVRPPETTVTRAGNIVESICVGVMVSVVRDPGTG